MFLFSSLVLLLTLHPSLAVPQFFLFVSLRNCISPLFCKNRFILHSILAPHIYPRCCAPFVIPLSFYWYFSCRCPWSSCACNVHEWVVCLGHQTVSVHLQRKLQARPKCATHAREATHPSPAPTQHTAHHGHRKGEREKVAKEKLRTTTPPWWLWVSTCPCPQGTTTPRRWRR